MKHIRKSHAIVTVMCYSSILKHVVYTDLQLAPLCSIFPSVVLALSKEYSSKMPDHQIDSSLCAILSLSKLLICNFLWF